MVVDAGLVVYPGLLAARGEGGEAAEHVVGEGDIQDDH